MKKTTLGPRVEPPQCRQPKAEPQVEPIPAVRRGMTREQFKKWGCKCTG
jgi:hypothetical protein